MSHEITSTDHLFTVRKAAWHGLGDVLDEYPDNWDDARMASGLMWEPRLVPLYTRLDDGTFVVDGAQRVERDDNGDRLGTVSESFELLTNGEMGPIVESLLDRPNVRYETAGSVRGGKIVWCLLRLDEPMVVAGDVDPFGDPVYTFPYLTLINYHDGTGAARVVNTMVRTVCMNTIKAAEADGDRSGRQFVFNHTTGIKDRIEEAKLALRGAMDEARQWQNVAAELFEIKIDRDQELTFLDEWMPFGDAATQSARVLANIERDRGRFMGLLDSTTNSEQRGTGLGMVNAAIEYLDHSRGFQTRETYFTRSMISTEKGKTGAVKIVRQLAGV